MEEVVTGNWVGASSVTAADVSSALAALSVEGEETGAFASTDCS